MSTTPIKSARVRNAVKAALGVAVAAPLAFAVAPASAADIQLGETTVDVGGFIRMDVFYDLEQDNGPSLTPADSVPNSVDNDGQFTADARYTRLSFSFNTPTAAGDIGGYIEADFLGGAKDGGALRLRQGFVTYGNWLIGKAWTPFFNGNFGPTVDFAGNAGAGMSFGRNWQVRYTFDFGGGGNLALALEIPDAMGAAYAPALAVVGTTQNPLPALTVAYSGGSDMLSYDAGLMLRDSRAQLNPLDPNTEDSVLGWAVNLGGTLSLDTGTSFKLYGVYGQGAGQYILANGPISSINADVYFDDSGELQTTEEWAVTATIAQQFTDTFSGAVQYSYFQEEQGDINAAGTDINGEGQAFNIGVFYAPADPLTFGLGYKWVSYEAEANTGGVTTDLFEGDANRITFSTTYSF